MKTQAPVQVGIIGAGNISGIYLEKGRSFPCLHLAALADLMPERAQAQASKYGIARVLSVDDLLADPALELIVNLTVPSAHAEVALKALAAGKSVYNEKPLATRLDDAGRMLELARNKGLRLGGAPDTFLGGGLQTCRKLLDDGWIGAPVAATACMLSHGPESWHPSPGFFYQAGGGPLFDMGPYYLTALITLLGPVRRVTGSAHISFPTRTITSQPLNGTAIQVETPTHVVGVLDFASGVVATLVNSFDVWSHNMPRLEIYGTTGSLALPDPNTFGGPVKLHRPGMETWADMPLSHGYQENYRSLGVADMAMALRTGRPHRASGELGYHVLEVMHAIIEASQQGRHIEIQSRCERPAALPMGLREGMVFA